MNSKSYLTNGIADIFAFYLQEHLNEFTTGRNPTLEDLGATQIRLEDRIPYEFMPYRFNSYYEEKVGEIPDPAPPLTVEQRHQKERDKAAFL